MLRTKKVTFFKGKMKSTLDSKEHRAVFFFYLPPFSLLFLFFLSSLLFQSFAVKTVFWVGKRVASNASAALPQGWKNQLWSQWRVGAIGLTQVATTCPTSISGNGSPPVGEPPVLLLF